MCVCDNPKVINLYHLSFDKIDYKS